ncbi:MAG: hypothetical protein D3X82_11480 [Candidatus Leucobacter sulfamidivorax]|nr:hypothetical protein [Candidatus Leucobacter sulfamidivorax]
MHAYAHAHAVARDEDSTRTIRTIRTPRTPREAGSRPRGIRRTAAIAAAALLGLAGLFAGSSPALAHDELVGYSVEADVSDGRAIALALHFSNEIMDVGTEIAITGPGGEDLTDGAPVISGRDVTQPLKHPLPEGNLAVAWRVVSSDGHPISGELTILSAADGTATAGPAGEEEHEHADDGHSDEEHAEDGHDHSEDAQETAETVAENGDSPVVTVVIVAVVAIAAIAAVAAVVVGTGRRRRAFEEAAAEANAGADEGAVKGADEGAAGAGDPDDGGKL